MKHFLHGTWELSFLNPKNGQTVTDTATGPGNIEPELQRERILKRNGQEKAEMFFNRWIPMEQKYFEAFKIREKCDIIL